MTIWLTYLAAWVLAAVIARRCFMVIYHMDVRERRESLLMFWAFGLSYICVFIAALGAAIHITEGDGITGDWIWLVGSTGLILFDRRSRR